MMRHHWKFQNRSVQTFGFVDHDTNGRNHGPVWKIQSFLLKGICTVTFSQDCYGKGNLRKSYWRMAGRKFQIENVSLYIVKKDYSYLCMWMTSNWLERNKTLIRCGKYSIKKLIWENQHLSFDRVHLGWRKDIVDNYRTMFESRISAGRTEKLPWSENLRISSWSNDVEGRAKKCVERYCELANRTIQQLYKVSTPCIDDQSMNKDHSHSWVRISHGLSRLVTNLNNNEQDDNEQETSEMQFEDYALKSNVRAFASRSKAKAKIQRRISASSSTNTIPLGERTWTDIESKDYLPIDYSVSKKLINLLRHGSPLWEDDGVIEFWRFKDCLRNHFVHSQHWSDEKWKSIMAKGGGNKRIFQYCTDSAGEILYPRALQGHSGRNLIGPSLHDNVIIPDDFFEYFYHFGCATNLHSIINSGLIPGGQNLSKKQTVFFMPVNPLDKEHKDPETVDLKAPRLARYLQTAWKKHQNTVCWVDIRLAQKERIKVL